MFDLNSDTMQAFMMAVKLPFVPVSQIHRTLRYLTSNQGDRSVENHLRDLSRTPHTTRVKAAS